MASHPDLRRTRTASLAGVALAILANLAAPSRPAFAEVTFEVMKSFERSFFETSELVAGPDGALYGTTGSAYAGGTAPGDRGAPCHRGWRMNRGVR